MGLEDKKNLEEEKDQTVEEITEEEIQEEIETEGFDDDEEIEDDSSDGDIYKEIAETDPDKLDELEEKYFTNKDEQEEEESPDENEDSPAEGQGDRKDKDIVTDELINSYVDEKDRAMLQSFKGKPISEVLKSYVHAQRLIGKRQEGASQAVHQEDGREPERELKNIPEPENLEEFNKERDKIVLNQLKKKFPNLPDDPEEVDEFLQDLNYSKPLEFDRFKEERKSIERQVTQDLKEITYTVNNYKRINADVLKNQAGALAERLSQLGVDDPTKIGFNPAPNEKGYNDDLAKLILDQNGDLDMNLFERFGKNPKTNEDVILLSPEKLTIKFFESKLPDLLNYARTQGREEGFKSRGEKRVLNSLASSNSSSGKPVDKKLTPEAISQMTPEEIDKYLEE